MQSPSGDEGVIMFYADNNKPVDTATAESICNRYGACLTYGGKSLFLDTYYKTETAASKAAIRARDRLRSVGINAIIRTCAIKSFITGYSSAITADI